MNPFEEYGSAYVPYRIFDQFSEMQRELVNINYDATNVQSKSVLGKTIKQTCFVCSSTKRKNNKLEQYSSVYEFNTLLGNYSKLISWVLVTDVGDSPVSNIHCAQSICHHIKVDNVNHVTNITFAL